MDGLGIKLSTKVDTPLDKEAKPNTSNCIEDEKERDFQCQELLQALQAVVGWLVRVLQHINPCGLYDCKSCSYMCVSMCMVCKLIVCR